MLPPIEMLTFPIDRVPVSTDDLLQFGLWTTSDLLRTQRDGRQDFLDGYFLFSRRNDQAMMLIPPGYRTKPEKECWTQCVAGMVQQVQASGLVYVVRATTSQQPAHGQDLNATSPPPSKQIVMIVAETQSGERAVLVYDMVTGENGEAALRNGKRLNAENRDGAFMADLFTRTVDHQDAIAYARAMQKAYPEECGSPPGASSLSH